MQGHLAKCTMRWLVVSSSVLAASALTTSVGAASCRIGATSRRGFLSSIPAALSAGFVASAGSTQPASAFIAGTDEEKSGLTVLRVAEVCNFQEKLLRSLAACANPKKQEAKDQFGNPYCGGEAYSVNPTQIVFGTGVMLRNANLDGNLKVSLKSHGQSLAFLRLLPDVPLLRLLVTLPLSLMAAHDLHGGSEAKARVGHQAGCQDYELFQ